MSYFSRNCPYDVVRVYYYFFILFWGAPLSSKMEDLSLVVLVLIGTFQHLP